MDFQVGNLAALAVWASARAAGGNNDRESHALMEERKKLPGSLEAFVRGLAGGESETAGMTPMLEAFCRRLRMAQEVPSGGDVGSRHALTQLAAQAWEESVRLASQTIFGPGAGACIAGCDAVQSSPEASIQHEPVLLGPFSVGYDWPEDWSGA